MEGGEETMPPPPPPPTTTTAGGEGCAGAGAGAGAGAATISPGSKAMAAGQSCHTVTCLVVSKGFKTEVNTRAFCLPVPIDKNIRG